MNYTNLTSLRETLRKTANNNVFEVTEMDHTACTLVVLALLSRCAAINRYNWCKNENLKTDCTNVIFTENEGIDLQPSNQLVFSTMSLVFSHNQFKTLTGNGPLAIFPALVTLEIEHNELTSISDNFFNGVNNLQILGLSNNYLTTIPKALYPLTSIKFLLMNHNKIKGKINESIVDSIQNLKDLKTLDISDNQIDGFEGSPFIKLPFLIELHLSGNKLRTFSKEALSGLNTLTHLYLDNTEINDLPKDVFSLTKNLRVIYLESAFKPGMFTLTLDHFKEVSLEEINFTNNIFMCDCSIEWLWQEITGKLDNFGRSIKGLRNNRSLKCFSLMLGTLVKIIDLQDGFCARRIWSSWGSWGECVAFPPCENNVASKFQHRRRLCLREDDAQSTQFPCLGEASEKIECGTETCDPLPKVDGGWSAWTPWSLCSASCSEGITTRQRLCDNPKPQSFGHACNGKNVETKVCNERPCPYIKVVEINATRLWYMESFLHSHAIADAKMKAVMKKQLSSDIPLLITVVSTSIVMLLLYCVTFLCLCATKRKKRNNTKYGKTRPTDFNSYHEDVRKKEEDKVNRFLQDKSWFGGSDETSGLPPMPFKSRQLPSKVFADGFVYNGKFIQNRPKESSGYPSTPERPAVVDNIYEETTSKLKLNEVENLYGEVSDNDSISSASSFNESSKSVDYSKNDSQVDDDVNDKSNDKGDEKVDDKVDGEDNHDIDDI